VDRTIETMTGYLTQQANTARLDDMRLLAEARSQTRGDAQIAPSTTDPIAIRCAGAADGATIERLAALDSTSVPAGEMLIAEVAGEPRAAIEIATGKTIADPFRATTHLIELLSLRAATLAAPARPRSRFRLRLPQRATVG
jgi:hypothetical protein